MKFKLNAIASVCLMGTLLGCAQLMPGTRLASRTVAPPSGEAGALPVKVAQAPTVSPAMPSSAALFAMGLAAHGAGQLALASQRYEQVLALTPEHVGALNALAVIYAQSDRTDAALPLFRRAMDLAPGAAHVRNNTGYALLRDGRLDEAELELKLALELDPSSLQTQQNLVLLANAKAASSSISQATVLVPSDVMERGGPRLVAVAPHVYELQVSASAHAQAMDAAQEQVNGSPAADSPQPAVSSGMATPQLAVLSASTEMRGVRLEVSNGVGINRLARRTADRLAKEGVLTARLTNALPYRQTKTEIQFVTGQAPAAQALQSRMPVAVQAVPKSRLNAGIQMRLVLGHDLIGRALAEWLDAEQAQQLATAVQGGWRWS